MAQKPEGSPFFQPPADETSDEAEGQGAESADDAMPKDADEESLDSEENPLFSEDSDESEDDDEETEEDEDDSLFEDEKLEKRPDVPYDRFSKVIGQRNELRSKLETIEGRLEVTQAVQQLLDDKYSQFKDPAAQVGWDAEFVGALENLIKEDGSFAEFAQAVESFMETGKVPKMSEQTETPETNASRKEPQPDARVDVIIERDARRTIDEALAKQGVKPSFRDIVADYMIGSDAVDNGSIRSADAVKFTKTFIAERGFTQEDVLENPSTEERKGKPATKGSPGTATATKDDSDGGESDAPKGEKPPQTRNEWDARRDERRRALFSS